MKIFGREPAALVAALQSFLILAVSFGWLSGIGLDGQDDIALVIGVVTAAGAVVLAYKTSETLLAPVIELFKAGLAFAAIYGFALTDAQTGSVIAAITTAIALFQRTQVAPLRDGNFDVPQAV